MSLVQRTVCNCDVCGHEWIPEVVDVRGMPSGIVGQALPKRCPSRKCRSTGWNKGVAEPELRESKPMNAASVRVLNSIVAARVDESKVLRDEVAEEDWPKPVAELEDTAEPYQNTGQRKRIVVGETLTSSLCRHQLYAGTCPRCKYGTM